ncbi:protein S100-B isoform X1 [Gopherus flavomarginatus]|uniref:protein S100-B isoform X1 n=1 Tax=Gopherus flavomarginatus TaxID=286002 RepID=UPI0021CC2467|nr:protein S100-B isoform X1 [Gopherus flavomarginatus]
MHPCVYFHPFQEIRSKNQLPASYSHPLLRSSLAAAVLQKHCILVDGLLHSPTDEIRRFPLAVLEYIALIPAKSGHRRKEIKDQETVDKVMETLDADGDAECDFQEFVAFIAMVTSACHEFFEHE